MEKSKIIKLAIKNELNQINSLTLDLATKYDNELKELDEKYKSEKDIYLKSYLKTLIEYTENEIEKLDNMIFEIEDLSLETNIEKVIKELLEKEIISLDNWHDGQSTYEGLEIVGVEIIKYLLFGFKLISLFEKDVHLIEKAKRGGKLKDTSTRKNLQKSSELTSNFITKKLLEEELRKIDENNSITKELLLKSVFYHISKSLMLFKGYEKDKVEKITNNIIKEVYKAKRLKGQITDKELSIKYDNHSFGIYQ